MPASIERQNSEITVVQNSDVTLTCTVSGQPTPAVHWSRHNVIISADDVRYRVFPSHVLALPIVRYTANTALSPSLFTTIYTTLFHQSGSNRQRIEKNLTK